VGLWLCVVAPLEQASQYQLGRRRAAAVPTNADAAVAMQSIANSTGAAKSLGSGVRSPDPGGVTSPGPACAATERAALGHRGCCCCFGHRGMQHYSDAAVLVTGM
jgi:hypothetical protein